MTDKQLKVFAKRREFYIQSTVVAIKKKAELEAALATQHEIIKLRKMELEMFNIRYANVE